MEANAGQNPSTQQREALESYLELAQSLGVIPNFWMSREYLEKAKASVCKMLGWVWVEDENGETIFPPITDSIQGSCTAPPVSEFWSDCHCSFTGWYNRAEFLDYEFIYDPKNFTNIEGKKWKLFRKNVKKWPEQNPGITIYAPIQDGQYEDEIEDLMMSWIDGLVDDQVEDAFSMIAFIRHGENRKGLFNNDGELVGLNIWDENWSHINFRWSLTRPEPHLNAFMRWLFYQDPTILIKNKLVNDGGCVGRESLKFFKEKMNPLKVRKVYSYKLKSGVNKP